jgi:galactonate dehydratase
MKVTDVQTFLIGAQWRNFTFVKITTDTGIVGWGEATLGSKETAVKELVQDFGRRYVIGRDPFEIERIWSDLWRIEFNLGPVMLSAMAGIEMALWDIAGKACNQPVYNLVGGKVRSEVRVYANGWYGVGGDIGKLAERAGEVVARGYTALKFDPFGAGSFEISRTDLREACRKVEAVRKAVGDDIDILLEFHGRFSPISALEAIRAMVPYAPSWCEEPVPPDSRSVMSQVTSVSPLRIATGEHVYSRFAFVDLLMSKATHVLQPDITYTGGFLETKKIAAMAEAHYVSIAPHNCDGPLKTIASMHLAANIPNFLILETFQDYDVHWRAELAPDMPPVVKGFYTVPSDPGWGITIDEKVFSAHPPSAEAKLNMFASNWEYQMCNPDERDLK